MLALPYPLYVDNAYVGAPNSPINVTNTGCTTAADSVVITWTYSGSKIFKGFEATGNVTPGTYLVGSTITAANQDSSAPIYLTTIEEDNSLVKIAESKIQELADAVRTYVGSSDSYTLAQMAEAINPPKVIYIVNVDSAIQPWPEEVEVADGVSTWADLVEQYPSRFMTFKGRIYQKPRSTNSYDTSMVYSDFRLSSNVSSLDEVIIGNTYYTNHISGGTLD